MPKISKPTNAIITASSGDVFADLGFPNADEMLARAELMRQINRVIARRGLTQAQAAKLLGVAQPNVSALKRGRLSDFSLDRLIRFLVALGQRVEINVRGGRVRPGLKVA